MFSYLYFLPIIYYINIYAVTCNAFEFDQDYFGVFFQPYVKKFKDGERESSLRSYTKYDIKAMLQVISRKFSRIIVRDDFDFYGEYEGPDYSYYYGSYPSLWTGETGAEINRIQNHTNLTVLYQLKDMQSVTDTDIEISLAFEAAQKANSIFPGTVEGISLAKTTEMSAMQNTLEKLRALRLRATQLGVKLGVEQNCFTIRIGKNDTFSAIQRNIIREADFIVCGVAPSPNRLDASPVNTFNSIGRDLLAFKYVIGRINEKADVIAKTQWSSAGLEKWQTVENLKTYWGHASAWATENSYRVYLSEAFDNPYQENPPSNGHKGWWKLKENLPVDSVNSYLEKISELHRANSSSLSTTTVEPDTTNNDKSQEGATDISSHGWSDFYTTIAVIGGVCVILTLLILLVYLFWRGKRAAVLNVNDVRAFHEGTTSGASSKNSADVVENAMNRPYDNSLEIPKSKLKINDLLLGSGQFGFVFKAAIEFQDGEWTEVAAKIAKENCDSTGLKGLLSELKLMAFLGEHANIVVLKGAYTAELIRGVLYILTEFCALGSLQGYLRNNQPTERGEKYKNYFMSDEDMELTPKLIISFAEMLQWSHEIACGMAYLERKQVVHADLATRNVLLTADKTAKIADFGLSRRMYNYMNYVKKQNEPLPWRWMAVESLKQMVFSSKSDVWSYGVTLWEIFSAGDSPYPGLNWSHVFVNRLTNGLRPDCPRFASPEIYNIMRECWNFEPKERPGFNELITFIDDLLKTTGGQTVYEKMEEC